MVFNQFVYYLKIKYALPLDMISVEVLVDKKP